MGKNSQERSQKSGEISNATEVSNKCNRETSPFCPFPPSSTIMSKKFMDNKVFAKSAIRLFSAFLTGLAIGLLLVPRIFGR
jgi:hypothetical protein